MNDNGGGILGRFTALALIAAVIFSVRAIMLGGLGCPLRDRVCCGPSDDHSGREATVPAAADELSGPDAPKNIPASAK